jgi:hypothetical protein
MLSPIHCYWCVGVSVVHACLCQARRECVQLPFGFGPQVTGSLDVYETIHFMYLLHRACRLAYVSVLSIGLIHMWIMGRVYRFPIRVRGSSNPRRNRFTYSGKYCAHVLKIQLASTHSEVPIFVNGPWCVQMHGDGVGSVCVRVYVCVCVCACVVQYAGFLS